MLVSFTSVLLSSWKFEAKKAIPCMTRLVSPSMFVSTHQCILLVTNYRTMENVGTHSFLGTNVPARADRPWWLKWGAAGSHGHQRTPSCLLLCRYSCATELWAGLWWPENESSPYQFQSFYLQVSNNWSTLCADEAALTTKAIIRKEYLYAMYAVTWLIIGHHLTFITLDNWKHQLKYKQLHN